MISIIYSVAENCNQCYYYTLGVVKFLKVGQNEYERLMLVQCCANGFFFRNEYYVI